MGFNNISILFVVTNVVNTYIMKKIIALGASNSRKSINKELAGWAAGQTGFDFEILDLNDFEMPIYSIDRESESGIPEEALQFKKLIKESDGIIMSFAEHNGSFTAAFKNIMDWVSRIEKGIWADKPLFLLATSPGGRGAQTILKNATDSFPHRGGQVIASFSLPSFSRNFDAGAGITESELAVTFNQLLNQFKAAVNEKETEATASGV